MAAAAAAPISGQALTEHCTLPTIHNFDDNIKSKASINEQNCLPEPSAIPRCRGATTDDQQECE